MGNSPNYDQMRISTHEARDKSLNKYLPIFEEILKKPSLNPKDIE